MMSQPAGPRNRIDAAGERFQSRRDRMQISKIPLEAARWLLLANIALSACLYGGTRPWARETIAWLLLANTALFAAGLLARLRLPRVPAIPALATAFLLAQGWFLAWNARKQFIAVAGAFVDRIQPLPGWPGYLDQALVFQPMLLATGLLGAFATASDMSANRVWRNRLWVALAATGAGIVALGLAQRLTDAPSIFWDLERNIGNTFFAVFRYHANAGAFINLSLPLAAALALQSFQPGNKKAGRVFWTLAVTTMAAASFINVSRAANTISAAIILLFAAWAATFSPAGKATRRGAAIAGLAAVLAGVALLAVSFGTEKTVARWHLGALAQLAPESGRVQAYRIIVAESLPAAGAFGTGPGTFESVFETHRARSAIPLAGRFDFAHSDALQAILEWGWAGGAAWFAIFGGAVLVSAANAAKNPSAGARILSAACTLSLAGALVHGCIDFPFQIPSIQLFALCTAALAWQAGRRTHQRNGSAKTAP
jgi:O-antigen ligase